MASLQNQAKVSVKEIRDFKDVAVLTDLLGKHLAELQNANTEDGVVKILTDRTLQLIVNTLDVIRMSAWQEGLYEIIDKITDILMAGNEAGKEAKRCIILSLTESCMDVIVDSTVLLVHKIEILKSFNIVLENCSAATKCDMLVKPHFNQKMSSMYESISQVGDYEIQVCIIEFIFRLVPKSMRTEYLKGIVRGSELSPEFLHIQDNTFEIDCRNFLNKLNEHNTSALARVYSYPAESVIIDNVKLLKPSDEGYDHFWIDFNKGSRRIGIFCEPNFLSSQHSHNEGEQMWETVSIWAHDVKKYSCTVQGRVWSALIELKAGGELLSNKEPDGLVHLVKIAVPQQFDLKSTLDDVLSIHPKSSSVDVPIFIVKKSDTGVSSCSSQKKNVTSHQAQVHSQRPPSAGSAHPILRSKISVPSEPMTTPASSVITSLSDNYPTWQELQEKQNRQKIEVKISTTSSACYTGETGRMKAAAAEAQNKQISDDVSITYNKTSKDSESNISMINIRFAKPDSCMTRKVKDSAQQKPGDGGDTSGKYQTQAKVKASVKCTDAPWHHGDARASAAVVNVSKPVVVDERKHTRPEDTGATGQSRTRGAGVKSGVDTADTKLTRSDAHQQKPNKNKQQQESGLNNSETPNNGLVRQTRSQKARKARGISATPVQLRQLKPVNIMCGSQNSQADVVPGSLQTTTPQRSRKSTPTRSSQKRQPRTPAIISDAKALLETTISSISSVLQHTTKSSSRQHSSIRQSTKLREIVARADNEKENQAERSPDIASLEDFKTSRDVQTGGKRKVESSTVLPAVRETPVNVLKQKRRANHGNRSHEMPLESDRDSNSKTLKDFIPMLQVSKQAAQRQVDKNRTASQQRREDSHHLVQAKSRSPETDQEEACSPKLCTESKTTQKMDMADSPKADRPKRKTSEQSEQMSPSSSGELFVVVEGHKNNMRDNGDIIAETQVEISQPSHSPEVMSRSKKQQLPENQCHKYHLPSKSTTKSIPVESNKSNTDRPNMQMSSNLQSSYVFNKQGQQNHIEYEGVVKKTCKIVISTPKSEKQMDAVLRKQGSSVQESSKAAMHIYKTASQKTCVKNVLQSATSKAFSQVVSHKIALNEAKQDKTWNPKHVVLPSQDVNMSTRNKTVSYQKYGSDFDYEFGDSTFQTKNSSDEESEVGGCSGKGNPSPEARSRSVETAKRSLTTKTKISEKTTNQSMSSRVGALTSITSKAGIVSNQESYKSGQKKSHSNKQDSPVEHSGGKGYETSRGLWTSHQTQRTVTTSLSYATKSFAQSVCNLSFDPYDFDAECRKRSNDPPISEILRSNKQQDTENKKATLSDEIASKKNNVSDEISNKKHNVSDDIPSKKHNVSDKIPSKKHNVSDKTQSKKHNDNGKSFDTDHARKPPSQATKNIATAIYSKHTTMSTTDHRVMARPSSTKNTSKAPSAPSTTKRKSQVADMTEVVPADKFVIESDVGSSRFGLFASQYESDKSQSGLVFPPLDDPIPSSPVNEDQESVNLSEKKSAVSELSWLAQAKRQQEHQDKKKGKTYDRNRPTDSHHEVRGRTRDQAPASAHTLTKESHGSSTHAHQTPRLKKDATPGKWRLFHSLDIKTVSSKPPVSSPTESEEAEPPFEKTSKLDHKNRTLKSFLGDSPRSRSLSGNTAKRSPSLKSLSLSDNSLEPCESDPEKNLMSSRSCESDPEKNLMSSSSGQSSSHLQDVGKGDKPPSVSTWSLISSKIDQKLNDVIDRLSAVADQSPGAEAKSGPSSYKRPRRSELKRKYPNVSTTTDDGNQGSSTEQSQASSGRPHLIPRKLFKPDVTDVKSNQRTPETRSRTLAKDKSDTGTSSVKNQLQMAKRLSSKKTTSGQPVQKEKTPVKRHRQPARKSNPVQKFNRKVTSTAKYEYVLSQDSYLPERICGESSEEPALESTLVAPFDLSLSGSPVTTSTEKSFAECKIGRSTAEPQAKLLESVRHQLLKSATFQVTREDPDQFVDNEEYDMNETISTELDSLKNFLLKNNTKKTSLGGDDIQGAVKSTQKCITSLWETNQNKRMSAVEKFSSAAQEVFTRMNKDFKEMQITEANVTLLWTKEMEKMQRFNLSQAKELKRLKKAHEALMAEMMQLQEEGETAQKKLKTAMKNDLNALQRKLAAKYNEQSLEAMRRCLQMSLLS